MTRQQRDQAGNCIIRFISDAMAPARYIQHQDRFHALRDGLNEVMSLVGLRVTEQGKVGYLKATATTLDEIAMLAGRLRTELQRRGVHPDVLKYCEDELVRKSLFHAVFEANKGVSERLRQLSGSTLDGADLVDYCFAAKTGMPIVRINAFHTESETSEQFRVRADIARHGRATAMGRASQAVKRSRSAGATKPTGPIRPQRPSRRDPDRRHPLWARNVGGYSPVTLLTLRSPRSSTKRLAKSVQSRSGTPHDSWRRSAASSMVQPSMARYGVRVRSQDHAAIIGPRRF